MIARLRGSGIRNTSALPSARGAVIHTAPLIFSRKNLMIMTLKPLFALPALLLALTASANPATVTDDHTLRQALLGTWQAVDSPTATQINGEGTFTADGKASGYTTATYVYKDGYTSEVKINLSYQWQLQNGVITLDQFVSDPKGFIKATEVKRFEIQSITQDSLVLKDLADGEAVYRRRKPG